MDSLLLAPDLFSEQGGISRILRLYLKALCELSGEGESVRVISLNDGLMDSQELRRYSNGRLAEWAAAGRNKLQFCNQARKMAMKSDRIICGHIGQLPVAWALSKVRRRIRYYVVAHGLEVWRPFTLLERRSLKGATCVLCVSDYTRRQLLSHCAIRPERIAILPNALDPYLGTPPTEPQPAGAPVILTMTRLSLSDQYKGVDHLIEAMPAVRREIPDARLRVVGRGDALPSLQAAARRLGLEGVVEFVGYRSDADLHGDFASCRLFALPSQKEGFGLVYLEAMAHGRPCLGARSGGVPEVISEESGVLVDYGDVPGIAAAMVAALRRNWPVKPITERVETFSYDNFKRRLGSLMSEHEKTAESR